MKFARWRPHACLRQYPPLVKICGVRSVRDAEIALQAGADFVGMIAWQKSRRAIPYKLAAEISACVRGFRGNKEFPQSVAIVVEETSDQIHSLQRQTGVDLVQLHGNTSKLALPELGVDFPVIYVVNVDEQGIFQCEKQGINSPVEYVLVDGKKGGSGVSFPLENFQLPGWIEDRERVKRGWILAGGLCAENVVGRLEKLEKNGYRPRGVDVSSGVCDESGLQKDKNKIETFLKNTKSIMKE